MPLLQFGIASLIPQLSEMAFAQLSIAWEQREGATGVLLGANINTWLGLQWLGQLLIVLLFFAAFMRWTFNLVQPRLEFKIQIEQGVIKVVAGKVRSQFLNDLADVIRAENLTSGMISGRRRNNRVVLKYSREFSPAVQQQIRNAWYANF